jgi:hypothetical protein
MERPALDAAVAEEAARLREAGARVLLPEADGVLAALTLLRRRGLVREAEGIIGIAPERAEMADYYAATVLPLIQRAPDGTAVAELETVAT